MKRIIYLTIIFSLINQLSLKAAQGFGLINQDYGESKRVAEHEDFDQDILLKKQASNFQILSYKYPKETKTLLEVLQNNSVSFPCELGKLIVEYCESPSYGHKQIQIEDGPKKIIQLSDGDLAFCYYRDKWVKKRYNNSEDSLESIKPGPLDKLASLYGPFIMLRPYYHSIAQLKNGNLAICWDKKISIFTNKFFDKPQILIGHEEDVYDVIELNDGKLASCSLDGTIKIWQQDSNKQFICCQTLYEHAGAVMNVIQLKNGDLASASDDHTIKIWRQNRDEQWEYFQTLQGHEDCVYCLIELDNGNIVSCSGDRTIKVWKLNCDGSIFWIETVPAHTQLITSLIKLKNGDLASAANDGFIKIWRVNSNETLTCIETLQTKGNFKVAEIDNGTLVSYRSSNPNIEIFRKPFSNLFDKTVNYTSKRKISYNTVIALVNLFLIMLIQQQSDGII